MRYFYLSAAQTLLLTPATYLYVIYICYFCYLFGE